MTFLLADLNYVLWITFQIFSTALAFQKVLGHSAKYFELEELPGTISKYLLLVLDLEYVFH